MFSIDTEIHVSSLLLSIAEGERNIEISRQVLSDTLNSMHIKYSSTSILKIKTVWTQ